MACFISIKLFHYKPLDRPSQMRHDTENCRETFLRLWIIRTLAACWIHFPTYLRHVCIKYESLRWRHNECDSVSNHQPHDCLLNRLFRRRSKKTSKLRATSLCPVPGEFPAQMTSNAENVSTWWRDHDVMIGILCIQLIRLRNIKTHWGRDKDGHYFPYDISNAFPESKCINFD